MTKRKIAIAIAAAALAGTCAIGGTLAWLTADDSVTNTFTIGNVHATIDEDDITNSDPSVRVDHNEYSLYPNANYTKDPTVHLTGEECYVFVTVDNPISADVLTVGAINTIWGSPIATQGTTNVYVYNAGASVDPDVKPDLEPVFTTISVPTTVTNEMLNSEFLIKGEPNPAKQIVVNAYAIQANGLPTDSDYEDAYNLLRETYDQLPALN